ncbi:MAG TPA: type II toxin-antitoxin system RelE/ParE family toxin [Candidatus Paceibacterota bacterium]|nr:hypothetical protein [uncultured archaeon]
MNKIEKFLKKLIPKDRDSAEKTINSILSGKFDNLDIKKLQGFDKKYRVRIGKMRIQFYIVGKIVEIERIEFRNDNTY